jgi:hypothetical protein
MDLDVPSEAFSLVWKESLTFSMFVHEIESNHGYYHTELSLVDRHGSLKI